jgi:hypothetical protein
VSSTVLRRLLAASALGLLAAVAAGGCASDVSPAVRVNGAGVSDRELLDEVGEWVNNPSAGVGQSIDSTAPGTYPQSVVGQVLGQRIDFLLTHDEFEDLGLRLTDDDRAAAVSALFQGDTATADKALGGFSRSYREYYVDSIAEQIAVQDHLGADFERWRSEAYDTADVDVSPKYGTWDKTTGQINPPSGPQQPASDQPLFGS